MALAAIVAAGQVDPRPLGAALTHKAYLGLTRLTAALQSEPPTPAPPVVVTGPGGDYTRPWP